MLKRVVKGHMSQRKCCEASAPWPVVKQFNVSRFVYFTTRGVTTTATGPSDWLIITELLKCGPQGQRLSNLT